MFQKLFLLFALLLVVNTAQPNDVVYISEKFTFNKSSVQAEYQGSESGISVINYEGNFDKEFNGVYNAAPRQAIIKTLVEQGIDHSDFVVFFTLFPVDSGGADAFYSGIKNDVSGIGLPLFNNQNAFDSNRLQGIVDMTEMSDWVWDTSDVEYDSLLDTLIHEVMHRWGPAITYDEQGHSEELLLGRDNSHWNYFLNSHASVMYGSLWSEMNDGSFKSIQSRHALSALDLYLMGMKAAATVPDFFVIENGLPGDRTDIPPTDGAVVTGNKKLININDVIAAEGVRSPSFDESQHQFNMHFVIIKRFSQEVSDQDIGRLLTLQKQFQYRFQADTAGVGSIEYPGEVIQPGVIDTLSYNPVTSAAYSENQAIQFLFSSQISTRAWEDKATTAIRDTVAVLQSMQILDQTVLADRARVWLKEQTAADNDQAAWLLLSGVKEESQANALRWQLISSQNEDGGWGLDKGDASNPYDTALVLLSLKSAFGSEYVIKQETLDYLSGTLNSDFGAGFSEAGSSSIAATAKIIQAMDVIGGFDTEVGQLADYLIDQQSNNGSIGSLQETLVATEALMVSDAASHVAAVNLALDFINQSQSVDNSYEGSVFSTAIAARLLSGEQRPNFKPISVELSQQAVAGEQALIKATFINNGQNRNEATTVGIIHNGTLVATEAFEQWPSSQEQVAEMLFDTTGLSGTHSIMVKADAEELVAESNEQDNEMVVSIDISAPSSMPELAFRRGQSEYQPHQFDTLPFELTADAVIENLSTQDVNDLNIGLYRKELSEELTLISEQTHSIDAGQSTSISFSHNVTSAEGDLEFLLILDDQQVVSEVNENNNSWLMPIKHQPSIDLEITAEGINTPSSFVVGNQHSIDFDFSNKGTLLAPSFQVSAVLNDSQNQDNLYQADIIEMSGGETANRQFYWTPEATGNYSLLFRVDSNNAVAEFNEDNNEVIIPITVVENTATNIKIEEAILLPSPGLTGEENQLQVTISNDSSTQATAFNVHLSEQFTDGSQDLISTTEVTSGVGAASSIQHVIDITEATQVGDTTFIIHIDADHQVNEFNENDNLLIKEFRFLSEPDAMATPAALSLNPSQPVAGANLELQFSVANLGEQSLNNLTVDWYAVSGSQTPEWIGQTQITEVSGGASEVTQLSYIMPADNQITAFQVTLDQTEAIEESNENNNQATQNIQQQNQTFYLTDDIFSPNGDGIQDITQFVFNAENTDQYSIVIYDFRDRVVRTFAPTHWHNTDKGDVIWDGRDDEGKILTDGAYRVTLSGVQTGLSKHLTTTIDTNRTPMLETLINDNGIHYDLSCLTNSTNLLGEFTNDGKYLLTTEYIDKENDTQQGLFKFKTDASIVESILPSVISNANYTQAKIKPIADGSVFVRSYEGMDKLFKINPESGQYTTLNTSGLEDFHLVEAHDDFALVRENYVDYYQISYDLVTLPRPIDFSESQGEQLNVLHKFNFWIATIETAGVEELILIHDTNESIRINLSTELNATSNDISLNYDDENKTLWAYSDNKVSLYKSTGENLIQMVAYEFPTHITSFTQLKKGRVLFSIAEQFIFLDRSGSVVGEIENPFNLDYLHDHLVNRYGSLSNVPNHYFCSFEFAYEDINQMNVNSPHNLQIVYGNEDELFVSFGAQYIGQVQGADFICDGEPGFEYTIGYENTFGGKINFNSGFEFFHLETLIGSSGFWEELSDFFLMSVSGANVVPFIKGTVGMPEPEGETIYQDGKQILNGHYSQGFYSKLFLKYQSLPEQQACGQVGDTALNILSSKSNLTAFLSARMKSQGIEISGYALDENFSHYEIDVRKIGGGSDWYRISSSTLEQEGNILYFWQPEVTGDYQIRLTAYDQAGNKQSDFSEVRYQNFNRGIKNIDVYPQYFSPNGDGSQDEIHISFDVEKATEVLVEIKDSNGEIVREFTNEFTQELPGFVMSWDGLDNQGQYAGMGVYSVSVNGVVWYIGLDTIIVPDRLVTQRTSGKTLGHPPFEYPQPLEDTELIKKKYTEIPLYNSANIAQTPRRYYLESFDENEGIWVEDPSHPHQVQFDPFESSHLNELLRFRIEDAAGNTDYTQSHKLSSGSLSPFSLRTQTENGHQQVFKWKKTNPLPSSDLYVPTLPPLDTNESILSFDGYEDLYLMVQTFQAEGIVDAEVEIKADNETVLSRTLEVMDRRFSELLLEEDEVLPNNQLPTHIFPIKQLGKRYYGTTLKLLSSDFDFQFNSTLSFDFKITWTSGEVSSFDISVLNAVQFHEVELLENINEYIFRDLNILPENLFKLTEKGGLGNHLDQLQLEWLNLIKDVELKSGKEYVLRYYLGPDVEQNTSNNRLDVISGFGTDSNFTVAQSLSDVQPIAESKGKINGLTYHLYLFEVDAIRCYSIKKTNWTGLSPSNHSISFSEQDNKNEVGLCISKPLYNQKFGVGEVCDTSYQGNQTTYLNLDFFIEGSSEEIALVELIVPRHEDENLLIWSDTSPYQDGYLSLEIPVDINLFEAGNHWLWVKFSGVQGSSATFNVPFVVQKQPTNREFINIYDGQKFCGTNEQSGEIDINSMTSYGASGHQHYQISAIWENNKVTFYNDGGDDSGLKIAHDSVNSLYSDGGTLALQDVIIPLLNHEPIRWNISKYTGPVDLVFESVNTQGTSFCDIKHVEVDTLVELNSQVMKPVIYLSPNSDGVFDSEVVVQVSADENLSFNVFASRGQTDFVISDFTLTEGSEFTYHWDGYSQGVVLDDGEYQLIITATDDCQLSRSVAVPAVIDTNQPIFTFESPIDQEQVPGIFEVQVRIDELNLDEDNVDFGYRYNGQLHQLEFELDELPSSEAGDYLLTSVVNLSGLPLDTYELIVEAVDLAGNEDEQSIFVHRVEPHEVIWNFDLSPKYISPDGDDLFEILTVDLGLNKRAQVTVEVLTEAEQLVTTLVNDDSMDEGSYSLSWAGLDGSNQPAADGSYLIRVSAYDPDIPAAVESLQLPFAVDTTLPVLVYQPADSVISGEGMFKTLVTEDHVLSTQFWLQPQSPLSAEFEVYSGGVSGELDLFDLGTLDEGLYQLRAEIKDRAGHTLESTHSFTVDNTAAVVSWIEPENEAVIGGESVDLNVSIDELHFDSGSIDGSLDSDPPVWQNITPITELVDDSFIHEWPVDVEDGVYLMRALALDQAGHETEVIRQVTIDRTPPAADISSPANPSTHGPQINIIGTVTDANLSQYQLSYRLAGEGEGAWRLITVGVEEKNNETLFEWTHGLPSGDYQIRLLATDVAEQAVEVVIDISIDVSPPPTPDPFDAELQAPNDVLITWGAVNVPDLAGYFVYRNGIQFNDGVITTTSITDADLTDGEYSYWVVAVDLMGNVSEATEVVEIMIDTTPPNVLILTPINQATVSGDVTVKGSVSTNTGDFKRADLYLRQTAEQAPGQLIYSTTLAVNSQPLATVDTTTLISGSDYIIRWQAEDISGNLAAVEHQITIDNEPPAAPLNLTYQLQGLANVDLNWTANSEGDLAGYVVFRNDAIISGQNIVNGIITETDYLDVDAPDGEHVYHVIAIDAAGNISTASNTVTVNINRRAPDAWFIEPIQGQEFETAIRLLAHSDDTDIAGMLFEYHTGDVVWMALEDDLEAPFDAILDPQTLNLNYGEVTIRVTARDQGGQTDGTPDEKTIAYTDLTAPAAVKNLVHVVNGGDVMLNWDAGTEPDLAGYQIHRKQLEPVHEDHFTLLTLTSVNDVSYTDSGLADGVYQYRIHAIDGHDNLSDAVDSEPATVWSVQINQPFSPLLSDVLISFDGQAPQAGTIHPVWQNDSGSVNLNDIELVDAAPFTVAGLGLEVGGNTLSVHQSDELGNNSRTAMKTVQLSPTPPMPLNPQSSVTNYDLDFTWQAPEAGTVGYLPYIDGSAVLDPQVVTGIGGYATSSNSGRANRATDGDPNSYWSPYSSDVQSEEPVWYQLNFNQAVWISDFTIDWYPDYHSDGGAALPSDYQVQYLSTVGWVTAVDFSGNSSASVSYENPVPYLTDSIRIWMPLPGDYQVIRLTEWQVNEQPLLTTTAYDATLSDGIYQVQVSAINAYGFESELTVGQEVIVGDVEAPDAVSLSGNVFDVYHVDLSWTASASTDVVNYRIFRNGELLFITADADQLSHQDVNLENGNYVYQVAAVDAAGNQSLLSNEIQLTISRTLIAAPENLNVTAATAGGVLNLAWDGVISPYLAYYQIHRSTSANSGFEPLAQSNSASWSDVVENGIRYHYHITAVDDTGNESSPSNIADGIALDLEAPRKPVILTPVAGGSALDVAESVTGITGLAAESLAVDLYHDGVWVDQVNTHTDSTVIETEYASYFSDIRISYGEWLAYNNGGNEPVRLYNPVTAETIHVALTVQDSDDYWWSHDGQVLYIIADDNGNERLYQVEPNGSYQAVGLTSDRIDVVSVSDDGSQLVYTGNGINPDTQVNEFGFWHLDLQTQELTAISLPQNVVLSHKAIEWANDEAIVFINFPNQTYNYGVLWRYDLTNQSLEQLDDETASRAHLITNHTKEYVYYENNQGGRKYISRVRLSDLTESSYYDASNNVTLPAVGEDPDLIFVAIGYGDHALLNIDTNTLVELFEGVGSEMQSIWLSDGRIKATQGSRQQMFMPPGYFEFNQVALNAGVNYFHVIGSQANGLQSEPSDAIELNLLTAVLPDLAVHNSDIYLSPESLSLGDVASGVLVIKNEGQVGVNGIETHINLVYPDLTVLPILSSPLRLTMEAGEALTLNFSLNQLNQEGQYLIQLAIDPNQEITEVNEQNNTANKNFWVLSQQTPHLSVQLSEDQLFAGDELMAELGVYNPSPAFTGEVIATLTDSQGHPTGLSSSYEITDLAPQEQWQVPLSWPVDDLFAGDYLLHVQLFDDSDQGISQVIQAVTIVNQTAIQLSTDISPSPHEMGQQIGFGAQLSYTAGNTLVDGLLLWSVVNDSDQIVWQTQQDVSSLTPNDVINLAQGWTPSDAGQFTLWVEFSGHTVAVPLPFTVNETSDEVRLLGQISLNPARLSLDQNQLVDYQLNNTGTVDLSDVSVRLTVLDEAMSQPLIEDERTVSLTASAQVNEQASFDARLLSVGRYVMVLRADLSAHGLGWVTLDHLNFITLDEQAPDLTVISPQDQGVYPADITARADVSDQWSEVVQVMVQIDGQSAQVMQSQVGSSVYETLLAGLSEGVHQLSWQATDTVGNLTTLMTEVTVDVTPPEITVQGVTNQGLYATTVTADVVVTDLHLADSQITLNGVDYVSGTTISDEGGHLLMVTAVDAAGNRSNAQRQFTIDTTAPEVVITHPINNSETLQDSTSVVGQSEAGATIYLSLNGQNWQVIADHTGAFVFDDIPLVQGENVMAIYAQDMAMNTGGSVELTITYTLPVSLSGSLQAPTAVTIGNLVDVVYTVSNSSQQDVIQLPIQVRLNDLNDALLISEDQTADISADSDYQQNWPIDTSALTAGDKRLSLWVEQSGQWQLLAEQLIDLVDQTPPVIVVNQPLQQNSYGPDLTLQLTVSDAHSEVADVDYQLNVGGQWIGMSFDGTHHVADVNLVHDDHQVQFRAADTAGNMATSALIDFGVDAHAPEIVISVPDNGLITNQAVTINYQITDDHNHSHEARLNGQLVTQGHIVSSNGVHVIEIVAIDEFDNERALSHTFTIDQTAPVITITSPANGAQVSIPMFDLSGDISEAGQITVLLNGQTHVIKSDSQGLFDFSNLPLEPGVNTLEITAVDAAGNASDVLIWAVEYMAYGAVSGNIWHDLNGDGMIDGGEPAMVDIDVALLGQSRTDYAAVTDGLGRFRLPQVVPGEYQLLLSDPAISSEWDVTTQNHPTNITVMTDGDYVIDWGLNRKKPSITSYVNASDRKGRLLVLMDQVLNADIPAACQGVASWRAQTWVGDDISQQADLRVQLFNEQNQLIQTEHVQWSEWTGDPWQVIDNVPANQNINLIIHPPSAGRISVAVMADQASQLSQNLRIEAELNGVSLSSGEIAPDCAMWSDWGKDFADWQLIDITLYPEQPSDDPDSSSSGPMVIQQQLLLKQLLDDNGWAYQLTDDLSTFADGVTSGEFVAYLVLAENLTLTPTVMDELNDAVALGDGLFLSSQDQNLASELQQLTGAVVAGSQNASTVQITDVTTLTSGTATLAIAEPVLQMQTSNGSEVAIFSDLSTANNDAVISREHGLGQTLLFGFDVLLQATTHWSGEGFYQWIIDGIEHVIRSDRGIGIGKARRVQLTLLNQSQAVSGHVQVNLPPGVTLAYSPLVTTLNADGFSFNYQLADHDSDVFNMWLVVNESPAVINFDVHVAGYQQPVLNDQITLTAGVVPDLHAFVTNCQLGARPGQAINYQFRIENRGNTAIIGALADFTLNNHLASATWQCSGEGGGNCNVTQGSGNISQQTVNLPIFSTVIFDVETTVKSNVGSLVEANGIITMPQGIDDMNVMDNQASDSDAVYHFVYKNGFECAAPTGSIK